MMNLWDVNHSYVFEREYKAIIEATPHIRLRTKLPLEPKLISALLMACGGRHLLLQLQGLVSPTVQRSDIRERCLNPT